MFGRRRAYLLSGRDGLTRRRLLRRGDGWLDGHRRRLGRNADDRG
jgi:hypothetical protein